MSTTTLTSQYEFNMGGAMMTMGFTHDNQLFTQMMFVKKTAPMESISSVTQRKAPLSTKLQYDIKIRKANGKEQFFQSVQMDSADPQGQLFINELKGKLPSTCQWIDKLAEKEVNLKYEPSAVQRYPIEVIFMPGAGGLSGMGRGVQMWTQYGILALMLLPLPLVIYAFAAGCHQITTDSSGIRIKKLGGSYFTWEEVDRIEAGKFNLRIHHEYGSQIDSLFLLDFTLVSKSGKKVSFRMNSFNGKQFVKEMVQRKKMGEEMEKLFI